MRVLHILMTGSFTDGMGYQDNLLTEYQHKHGHEVILIAPNLKRNERGEMIETPEGEELLPNGVLVVRTKRSRKIFSSVGYYPSIFPLIKKYSPDMIFIHGLCTLIPQQAIAYKKNHPVVKIVADSHQDDENTYTAGLIHGTIIKFYKFKWKKWIKYVSKVYGTTSWRVSFAHKYYGIPEEKLDTLIMGVNSDALPSNPEQVRINVRKELGIPQDAFVFLNGGKIYKDKKITEALSAFEKMNNDKAYFILFGKIFDDVYDEIMPIISRCDHIKYLGFIDGKTVMNYLFAADFGVFPRLHSVLWEEAMGCELPCVFGRYPGGNHIDICDNCIIIDDYSENKILEVMNKVINDVEYYSVLKQNSIRTASAFSYHTIADKSVECMKEDF